MFCPTCKKDLPTLAGLRQHHAKVHGEHLPNRTCVGCETEFYDSKAQRKFCDDCNPNAGPHNGNWRNAKETGECRLCGRSFEYYPSDKPGVYCPTCVKESGEFLGVPYHEVHDIKRVRRECEHCGEKFTLLRSDVERDRRAGRFCSHKCLCLAMKESNTPETYNRGWAKIKRQARERDEYTCRKCGIKEEELEQRLDVHHIKPVREFDEPSDAHTMGNVMCLCRVCHVKTEWDLRSIRKNGDSLAHNQ